MEDAMVENDVEINNQSEASVGEKRKSEGKLRSKVWQHFTKIVKEDGKCDKCQCNHCQKLFNYSSRNGTTYLLRHITDGKCPIFQKENSEITISDNSLSQNSNTNAGLLPWKSDGPSSAQQCTDDEVELVPNLESQPLDDPTPVLSSSRSSEIPVKSAWMNECRSCVDKLVELVNGNLLAAGAGPDYSISAALLCLNEMEDIPQTSEMYLDAIEILQDAAERECLICLPPEPRRRWMQRVLHRRHPLRYSV
ncbi:hypothetical protein CASFOL_019211 [Castilleja foliolosa]|uniref:BED-type domain-containing protein n=1 Tax=Castilleja foliolosa TaxID=1961234 RepID=A0ABD3D4J3_9LAMI